MFSSAARDLFGGSSVDQPHPQHPRPQRAPEAPARLTPHHHSAWRRFTVLGQNTEAIAYSMHLEEAVVVRLLGEVREVRRATENQLGRS